MDVLVDNGILAKTRAIASRRKLLCLGSWRLPLICPYGLERTGGRKLHLGLSRAVIPFESESKPADTRKELGNLDSLL